MKIAATGHRPPRLGGYKPCQWHTNIKNDMREVLLSYEDVTVISGMALGIDQWWAEAALELGIPVIAAMPFKGMGGNWPPASREILKKLLDKCQEVCYIKDEYSNEAYLERDRWMVDNCDALVAYYDGKGNSGTKYTIDYAEQQGKPVICQNVTLLQSV